MSAMGIGYLFLEVAVFKSLKSIHTLSFPFFLMTGTILEIQLTYLAFLINLAFNSLSTSSLILGGIFRANILRACLIGLTSDLMVSQCSTTSLLKPGIKS